MRLNEGDLFSIPVTLGRVALGQVAWRRQRGPTDYLLIVFEGLYPPEALPDLDVVIERPICLQALTFDSSIEVGRWRIVGHRPIPLGRIVTPECKLMTHPPDEYAITDFTGKIIRQAGPSEAGRLPFPTSVSPLRLEEATQALAGLGPWANEYAGLVPPTHGLPLPSTKRRPHSRLPWRR